MSQAKPVKQAKRRGGLLRLRRAPLREERLARGPDLGDLRLQFLLGATLPLR
jgi:hypothetical protein